MRLTLLSWADWWVTVASLLVASIYMQGVMGERALPWVVVAGSFFRRF
jgi:hypothetical protein